MTNNDVLKRLRYAFDYSDSQMMEIFAHAGEDVSREQVCNWLKPEEDEDFVSCEDVVLATFLNGLIVALRGKKDGPQPVAEERLSNNMILMKLRIALNLKSDEMLLMLEDVDMELSQHELTALFRKPGHKHYRECKDQILRKFLKAVQLKFRGHSNIAESDTDEDAVSEQAGVKPAAGKKSSPAGKKRSPPPRKSVWR